MPPSFTDTAFSDRDIHRIGHGLVDLSLPKAEWTHAAHFAAALWVLASADYDAARDLPGLIRAYNAATGVVNSDTGGYHETITQASLRAARPWLEGRTLAEAHAALLASAFGRSDWPMAYWSKARLFSVEARRAWVEPDLQPLPF